jgi:hypothetical protein
MLEEQYNSRGHLNSMCRVGLPSWYTESVWSVMAHTQKPDFFFRRNGRVHLNRRGLQFSRLLAAEVCASAIVMLGAPRSEVVWRVLATNSIRQFPLHFPSRGSPCAITFQLDSTNRNYKNTLGFDPQYLLAKQTLIYLHLTLRKYPIELYSPSKWWLVHLYQPLCSRRMALKFRKPSPDCATGGAPSSEAKPKHGIKMQKVQIKVHLFQFNLCYHHGPFHQTSLDVSKGKKTIKC